MMRFNLVVLVVLYGIGADMFWQLCKNAAFREPVWRSTVRALVWPNAWLLYRAKIVAAQPEPEAIDTPESETA